MNYNNAYFEKSVGEDVLTVERELPEICFSGRSNVGKSSLINKLLGKKAIARVSSTPGKTVTLNFYLADGVRFVDLPGYGYAKKTDKERESFSRVTENYFKNTNPLKLCLQLVDMRRAATADDIAMLKYLKYYGIDFIVVLTKCDKLNKTEFKNRLEAFIEELSEYVTRDKIIPFSSLDGTGVEDIRKIIEKTV